MGEKRDQGLIWVYLGDSTHCYIGIVGTENVFSGEDVNVRGNPRMNPDRLQLRTMQKIV